MQASHVGRWVHILGLNAPIAFVGAVGVLLLLIAGVIWMPGLAEAQDDAEYVWAFEDFGRIVVHWDHEGLSTLYAGHEIASYTVRWRQRGTLTWNTIVQSPVDPEDPDILIGADLLPEGETYEIVLSLAFAGGAPPAVYPAEALLVYVDFVTARQQDESSDDVLYYTNTTTDSLYTVDLSTGAPSLVGATDANIYGLSYCDGVLYGASGFILYTINTSTGASTRVHATNLLGSLPARGLACVNNTLYAVVFANYRASLFIVNKLLGTSTYRGQVDLGGTTSIKGAAGHGDGMYTLLGVSNSPSTWLYSITTSGAFARETALESSYQLNYRAIASDGDDTLYVLFDRRALYTVTSGSYDKARVGSASITSASTQRLAYARIVSLDAPENITTAVAGNVRYVELGCGHQRHGIQGPMAHCQWDIWGHL